MVGSIRGYAMKPTLKVTSLILLIAIIALSCGSDPEGRSTVHDFLRAIKTDTVSYDYLSTLLDLDELVHEGTVYDYDTTIGEQANKDRFVDLLLPGGSVRERWISNQIIVGNSEVLRDTAIVEVSFIDQDAEKVKQYYNKMGVHREDDAWKIFAFRLF